MEILKTIYTPQRKYKEKMKKKKEIDGRLDVVFLQNLYELLEIYNLNDDTRG